jgi:predicted DNA-binding protein
MERERATTTARITRRRTKWRTVACNLPPQDRERLQQIMDRDGAKLGTLILEAVQSYLNEVNP